MAVVLPTHTNEYMQASLMVLQYSSAECKTVRASSLSTYDVHICGAPPTWDSPSTLLIQPFYVIGADIT